MADDQHSFGITKFPSKFSETLQPAILYSETETKSLDTVPAAEWYEIVIICNPLDLDATLGILARAQVPFKVNKYKTQDMVLD